MFLAVYTFFNEKRLVEIDETLERFTRSEIEFAHVVVNCWDYIVELSNISLYLMDGFLIK